VIPNVHLQNLAAKMDHGLDLEITVGEPNRPNVMQATTSGCMSFDGTPDFRFHILDYWHMQVTPFHARYAALKKLYPDQIVRQMVVGNQQGLANLLEDYIAQGYEGAMIRDTAAFYKYGRSTMKEMALVKYKTFEDDEATVVDFEELMSNQNTLEVGNVGEAKRSSHKAGMVPMNTLGALVVTSYKYKKNFSIGSGFSAEQRKEIWLNQTKYWHTKVKFKYFKTGVVEVPRFPIFLGWRLD